MSLIQPSYAIINNVEYGPYFGMDLRIDDKCNKNKSSSCMFPYSYNFLPNPYDSMDQAYKIFTNSNQYNFGVAEY